MKVLVIILSLVMATSVYAELSIEEEGALRELIARKTTLTSLADNTKSEALPLEIATLRKAREAKITERNSLMRAEDAKANGAKQAILDAYEIQIDEIEGQIAGKQSEINNLI